MLYLFSGGGGGCHVGVRIYSPSSLENGLRTENHQCFTKKLESIHDCSHNFRCIIPCLTRGGSNINDFGQKLKPSFNIDIYADLHERYIFVRDNIYCKFICPILKVCELKIVT